MDCKTFIDIKEKEEVLIYAKTRNSLVYEIEKLCMLNNNELIGYIEREAYKLNPLDVSCFISENNKVYALVGTKRYTVREKLYQLEEIYSETFLKINQSCFANEKKIRKFSSTITGSIMVTFDNNYKDYISRRELKNVKERMGL